MINLLPPELKLDYQYARRNYRLVNWLAACGVAMAGIGVLALVGLTIFNGSIGTYKTQVDVAQAQLARENITGVKKQVTDISNNLKLMVQVLSKEILFSKLLSRLGSITPSDVVLTNLTIDQTQTGMDLIAQSGSYNSAAQLQANLTDPGNQIFSKADIVSITCATGTAITNPKYPCTIDIQAQFTQSNPFLFINASNPGGKS